MKVLVYRLERLPADMGIIVANEEELEVGEAIALIERDEVKAADYPRGVVPPEWSSHGEVLEDGDSRLNQPSIRSTF